MLLHDKKKIVAIIQARMNSSRLPGKVLCKIGNKPILYYVVNQTRSSKLIDDIIIATTISSKDNKIVNFCKEHHIKYFRGSEKDVLDRYYKCAKKFNCDYIVRITSDCPLIDPIVIDKIITKFLKNSYDYVSNNIEKGKNKVWKNSECNFPQGMTVEISTFTAMKKAWKKAKKLSEREHVFPYIQFNPKLFKASNVKNKMNLSHIRCTVDRNDDLIFVKEICKRIKKKIVHIKDILKIIEEEPHLININNHIPFDEGYRISLLKDKKHGYK